MQNLTIGSKLFYYFYSCLIYKNWLISSTNDVIFSNLFLFEHCIYVHLSLPGGANEQRTEAKGIWRLERIQSTRFIQVFKAELQQITLFSINYHKPSFTVHFDWLFKLHVSTCTMSFSGVSVFMLQIKH